MGMNFLFKTGFQRVLILLGQVKNKKDCGNAVTVVSEKVFEGNEFPVYTSKGCHSQRTKYDGVTWNYVMSLPFAERSMYIF